MEVTTAFAEPVMARYNLVGDYPVQFLRKGYFAREGKIFHKTVSLKEWKGA